MRISAARDEDVRGIVAIYNEVLAGSTAIFSEEPVTVDSQRLWLRSRRAQGNPVLAAHDEHGRLIGFASYGDFRPWPGYRHTVEHSVYVAPGSRRQGLGRRLVEELLALAATAGKHAVIAAVDGDNGASLALHEQLGFEPVGRLPEVARKFDRWLDLVLLERRL